YICLAMILSFAFTINEFLYSWQPKACEHFMTPAANVIGLSEVFFTIKTVFASPGSLKQEIKAKGSNNKINFFIINYSVSPSSVKCIKVNSTRSTELRYILITFTE